VAIRRALCRFGRNLTAELVYALQYSLARLISMYVEDEGTTVGMTAAARIPIEIRSRPEARVFL
jgi:hypothetical protein